LDAAIDTLPEADRHVLLLHFVNEMTFPEIARRVGKSAATVQKQSRRALEKLQGILSCRGVTISVVILTDGLTAEMTKAAPVILVPALGSISSLGKTAYLNVGDPPPCGTTRFNRGFVVGASCSLILSDLGVWLSLKTTRKT